MAAHDIVPVPKILAELHAVLATVEDRIRWQVVRARNADLIATHRAQKAEQHLVDAAAQLRLALLPLLADAQMASEYREVCDRG